jgi:competence protein ComEC
LLGWLSATKWAVWQQPIPNGWVLISTCIAILLFIMPKGIPARWLGVCWLLPLVYWKPAAPQATEVWLTLLDVGQGLAAVIRTPHHTLVFDTGPKMGNADDAGQRVIIPFLRNRGISHIDTLIVSHGDSDHIGGASAVLAEIPVSHILTSVPQRFLRDCSSVHEATTGICAQAATVELCQAGQHWQWDGVTFTVLHPSANFFNLGNNSSCVLKVGEGKKAILLTGDIEKPAEISLLQGVGTVANALSAQIIIAPHHGSRTSSTYDFITAVQAKYVLFPVGYKNRFHFPSQIVMTRYLHSGAKLFDTATSGAISFHLNARGDVIYFDAYRESAGKFWY